MTKLVTLTEKALMGNFIFYASPNVHRTFRKHPRCLLNVFYTFNKHTVTKGMFFDLTENFPKNLENFQSSFPEPYPKK